MMSKKALGRLPASRRSSALPLVSLFPVGALVVVLLLATTLLATPSQIQAQATPPPAEPDAEAPADTSDSAESTETEEVEVPPELEHARATMRTFLEAFDPEKRPEDVHPLDHAATTLDLSRIDEELRKSQGRELAVQLKEILDKTELIDLQAIPARPEGDPWALEVPEVGEVVIASDDAGRWQFTAGTVERIPRMVREMQDRETVEGVTTVSPTTPAAWIRAHLPPSLLEAPFLLENWQWMALLLLVFLGVVADKVVTGTVQMAIQRYLARRMEEIDAAELKKALRPLGILTMAMIWWPGLLFLGLPAQILQVLMVAVKFVAIVAFVWTAYRMVDIVAAVLEIRAERSENKFDDLLVPLFSRSAKIFVVALGVVFVADNLDVEIASLLAGLGIGGLAFALAAQDTVKNIFGSLTVIVDQPFTVGDWVVVDGVEGTVVELGFRSTRIRTFYDSLITVPNANLISANVDNYGKRQYRRWSTTLSLTYDTPPETIDAFCEGVRELIRAHPYTRKDYFHVYLNKFSAASLDVLLYVFFDCPDWGTELREKQRLALDVLRLAREMGVDFAFPTQTIHLQQNGDKPDVPDAESYGDALRQGEKDARRRARALVESGVGDGTPEPEDAGEGSA